VQQLTTKDRNERVIESGISVQIKTLVICEYCQQATLKSKIMKCSGRNCHVRLCKNCASFINDKPFCANCIIDIIKNKSLLIITKGKI
jgi:hypothetical protein